MAGLRNVNLIITWSPRQRCVPECRQRQKSYASLPCNMRSASRLWTPRWSGYRAIVAAGRNHDTVSSFAQPLDICDRPHEVLPARGITEKEMALIPAAIPSLWGSILVRPSEPLTYNLLRG